MSESENLFAQQERNRRRSRWLVVGFVLFFAWLGFGGDWIMYLYTRGAPPGAWHHTVPWFGVVLGGIGAAMAAYAWSTGPQKVLWSTGARELVDATTAPQQQLLNVVDEMCIAAGIPRPKVYVIPDPDPNAFATGHDQNSSSIAVTQGLLDVCTRDELQGVIAHEMGHIKNLDVRLMTLLAALVGAVALIGNGVSRMFLYGGNPFGGSGMRLSGGGGGGRGGGSGDNDRGGGGGILIVVLLALWILSWILAPLITRLLALGVSRDREYLADAMSAQFTRNPMSLADALTKIESAVAPTKSIKGGAAHLCIADPVGRDINAREGKLAELFGTHPPIPLRIARLKAMAYQSAKAAMPAGGSAQGA